MTDQEFMQKYRDLEGRVKQLEAVINKVETDSEPKFERVEKNDCYYSVQLDNSCQVIIRREEYCHVDNNCYNLPNYFHTKERAQEVLDEIKFLLKLERLHDIYCPDYKPDRDDKYTKKYYIFENNLGAQSFWAYGINTATRNSNTVYFPTEEIAQKVCDILNKEYEDYDNS